MTYNNKSKPRVGILCSAELSPNMEAVLCNLGAMLASDFELHLATGPCATENSWLQNYIHHAYPVPFFNPASMVFALKTCLDFAGSNNLQVLINIAQPQTLGLAVVLAGKKMNIPTIVRMTGDSFGEARLHRQPWKRLKSWILHAQMAKLAYKRADYILAIGENLKNDLIQRKFDPDKIFVLPQPFDKGLFTPVGKYEKIEIKKELGLAPHRKTILFAGRLTWLKGADRILKIVEMVERKSDSFQFCLVGKGEYAATFKRFPSELVFLPGLVPHSQVFKYFQAADLLIFPSRTEGLPNAVLEALSCEVPVIAAPVGDISNWVSNLATEPEDYVEYILKGNYVLDTLPEILDFDRLKAAYIDLFNRVINKPT